MGPLSPRCGPPGPEREGPRVGRGQWRGRDPGAYVRPPTFLFTQKKGTEKKPPGSSANRNGLIWPFDCDRHVGAGSSFQLMYGEILFAQGWPALKCLSVYYLYYFIVRNVVLYNIIGPRSWTQARACILFSFFCMVSGTFLVVYKWWCELPHNFSKLSRDRFIPGATAPGKYLLCLCAALQFALMLHWAEIISIIANQSMHAMCGSWSCIEENKFGIGMHTLSLPKS
jgi:hypothetical protein